MEKSWLELTSGSVAGCTKTKCNLTHAEWKDHRGHLLVHALGNVQTIQIVPGNVFKEEFEEESDGSSRNED